MASSSSSSASSDRKTSRREHAVTSLGLALATPLLALAGPAAPPALATPPRQTFQVSEDQFRPLPGTKPPIMYADIKGGGGGVVVVVRRLRDHRSVEPGDPPPRDA